MAKRKHKLTLRVYDGAARNKQCAEWHDRYVLYFPYPKEWVENGHVADFLAFSFNEDALYKRITRCYWDEWYRKDGYADRLGKKVKIDTLPQHVQKWIAGFEKAWNDYVNDPDNKRVYKRWLDY